TVIAVRVGQVIAFGFVAYGLWRMLGGAIANGLWLAFIGWFLKQAADAQLKIQRMRDMLADYNVSQAMTRDYDTVSGNTTLQDLVSDHMLGQGRRAVLVQRGGHAEGVLTVHDVRQVAREKWPETTAIEAMSLDDCCEK